MNGSHHLVGGGAPCLPRIGCTVARQIEGLTKFDGDLADAGELGSDRLDLFGADQTDRYDGGTGGERQPCNAGTAAIQTPVE